MTDDIHRITLAASLPPDVRLLTADDVGAMLGYSAKQVTERFACKPDFPACYRIDGGRPRWKLVEVAEWYERFRINRAA